MRLVTITTASPHDIWAGDTVVLWRGRRRRVVMTTSRSVTVDATPWWEHCWDVLMAMAA